MIFQEVQVLIVLLHSRSAGPGKKLRSGQRRGARSFPEQFNAHRARTLFANFLSFLREFFYEPESGKLFLPSGRAILSALDFRSKISLVGLEHHVRNIREALAARKYSQIQPLTILGNDGVRETNFTQRDFFGTPPSPT